MSPAPRKPAAPQRPAASSAARQGGHAGAGEVRIIGGLWKRTRLPVPPRPGLRPTPDRVRETLFNWLGQDLAGWRCIDAFAGTGALGLEAASRGAVEVLLVESDAALADQLRRSCEKLGATAARVQRGDGVAVLRQRGPGSAHLVLLDPPFDGGLFEAALAAAAPVLAEDGFIYLEAPQPWDDAALAPLGLAIHRHLRAGAVHAHLIRKL
ncbi:methyltransferase [Paracidovorax avenae ATCC 19860]|uniref:Methyltransferase n=1 Tax=Paracidovorax avenae (strain ATCC 19860 / DSM 7227 / CCUG 15838 / JCM 20985 / LMG 2117 / NCPPB 1011) TaxID=643561 RepID=F0Q1M7_PARA1|nr:16S rRNA (guanine(966)-N(2))-methyltransferase RsmD [Paracidovorax avenae]ADX47669.1 methyltransferase [Paracidovorax avenae ATCC 19860]AVS66158.1 16S rRNA (guanine(966)-N(2))-methyltransferase RsmD [Paracidovorax avenae]